MSSAQNNASNLTLMQSQHSIFCKFIAIIALVFFLYMILFNNLNSQCFNLFGPNQPSWTTRSYDNNATYSPTNIGHIGFIVVSSLHTWKHRMPYTQSWWRPNVTRGYVFLDKEPTKDFFPWPSLSPPYQVNDDITKLKIYPKLVNPVEVRIFRSVLDMYKVGDKGLRWFIMCDDDTLFFVDNLVETLQKYDHTKFVYIGGTSECVKSNADFSFDMGYGGAGYALSYPLVEALSSKIDACIERYPYLYVSDHLAQSCLADMGIQINHEKGIHQIDLRRDISGLLSSHPQSPLITLHHFDAIDPIFPSIDRYESARHIMKPAKFDQSRLLQQTICYQRQTNWSFSVSWGYSTHIYENIIPRSILRKPLETFAPWSKNSRPPFYMFNTRKVTNDPCEAPHVFFFESIDNAPGNQYLTTYVRSFPRDLPPCLASGNHSADPISKMRVLSPATVRKMAGVIECCDADYKAGSYVIEIKIRSCMKDEVIA